MGVERDTDRATGALRAPLASSFTPDSCLLTQSVTVLIGSGGFGLVIACCASIQLRW